MTEPQISERSIFQSAIDKATPQERAAHLDLACGDNLELRRELEALLAAHDRLGSDLPPVPGVTLDQLPVSEHSGAVIGPYKLLQQIGEGGMGVVFMAEQTHPVRRKVALKLIKVGMDSRQVIARFESERQALAMMDHVNIARALDAGTTQSGSPYFVMELVHGVPISKYCDDNQLTPRQRLELFIPVCRAIQHAHQKGIIHRDIKPSNVMITLYDGKPVPKVIDFGVAKATEQKLTERTLFTQYGTMVGTLEHMSPEQAEMSGLGIDTRSDIYSLGVLLYELLTGSTPLSQKRVREIAYGEVLRLIKEEEPPRPSTRLSSSGDALASISAQRRMEPAKLAKLVRGELDWIVMKALEKDRNRRYETASAFAADVERYLEDQTVEACPPSAWYRGRKFARRNKTGLGIAALILLFIVLLGGGVGWETRDRAARRAETGRQVRDSLASARSLLAENKPAQARQKLAEAKAQLGQDRAGLGALASEVDAFDVELARFDEFFALIDRANEAQVPAEGEMIVLLGDRSGGVTRAPSRATSVERIPGREVPYLLQALALYGVLEGDDWSSRLEHSLLGKEQIAQIHNATFQTLLVLANDMIQRHADHRSGQEIAGEAAARRTLLYLQKAETARAATAVLYELRVQCWKELKNEEDRSADAQLARAVPATIALDHYLLGLQAYDAKNGANAVREFEIALRLEPTDYWSLMWLGFALCDVGEEKDSEGAAVAFTGCISRRPEHAHAYFCRGNAYSNLHRNVEAVTDYSKAIALDPQFAQAWYGRGVVRDEQGQHEDAINDLSRAIEITPLFAVAWNSRGISNSLIKQYEKALADFSKAIELEPEDSAPWSNRGMVHANLKQWEKALADLNKSIQLDPKSAWTWSNRGSTYAGLKQWDKALADFSKAIELDPKIAVCWSNRGVVYRHLKQWDKALADQDKAIEIRPDYAQAFDNRGAAFIDLKRWDKAFADLNKAIELDSTNAMAWCDRGTAYGNLKQFDKALGDLNKAIELEPTLALAWCSRGGAYDGLKQSDKALTNFNKAIELEPTLAEAWSNRGSAYFDLKQWEKSLADQNKAIELDSNLAEAWINRGAVRTAMGQHEMAINDVNRAIELAPDNAMGWANRGLVYVAQGQTKRALVDLSKAVEIDPADATYWNNRGAAYAKLRQWDKAIPDLSKAVELDQKYADASSNLANLLSTCPDVTLRDPARAIKLLRKALESEPKDVASLQWLGWALYRTGAWNESIENFQKSMMLQETPKGGDSGQWFGLAMAYWQTGNKIEARKWYDQAVQWMEAKAPTDESFIRFRAEAEQVLKIDGNATSK